MSVPPCGEGWALLGEQKVRQNCARRVLEKAARKKVGCKPLILKVPEVGIEPTRSCPHGILSPNEGQNHSCAMPQHCGPILYVAKGWAIFCELAGVRLDRVVLGCDSDKTVTVYGQSIQPFKPISVVRVLSAYPRICLLTLAPDET